jgi:hypothetical protein
MEASYMKTPLPVFRRPTVGDPGPFGWDGRGLLVSNRTHRICKRRILASRTCLIASVLNVGGS